MNIFCSTNRVISSSISGLKRNRRSAGTRNGYLLSNKPWSRVRLIACSRHWICTICLRLFWMENAHPSTALRSELFIDNYSTPCVDQTIVGSIADSYKLANKRNVFNEIGLSLLSVQFLQCVQKKSTFDFHKHHPNDVRYIRNIIAFAYIAICNPLAWSMERLRCILPSI